MEPKVEETLSSDFKKLESGKIQRFNLFPSQNEVLKLLNELERNDRILLLRSLGVREITIEETINSLNNSNNESFFNLLKEWNFFQNESELMVCVQKMYKAQSTKQSEIPLKFFNELTINQFSKNFINNLSQLEIKELCKLFKLSIKLQNQLRDHIESEQYLNSIENLRNFDSLLRGNEQFNSLRAFIAKAISSYSGHFSYLSIHSKNTEVQESIAELLGSFHKHIGENPPKSFWINTKSNPKSLYCVMNWSSWESKPDANFYNIPKLSFKINLDPPPSPNSRQVTLKRGNQPFVVNELLSDSFKWLFESNEKKKLEIWDDLEYSIRNFVLADNENGYYCLLLQDWFYKGFVVSDTHRLTICNIIGLSPEERSMVMRSQRLTMKLHSKGFLSTELGVLQFVDVLLEAVEVENREELREMLDGIWKIVFGKPRKSLKKS